jgi:ABC-type nitrate/sulfonate/bicarbonate transport system substrate-binding protein
MTQHPDLVQKFLLGWYRAVAYEKTHKVQTLALAVKAEGLGSGHDQADHPKVRSRQNIEGRITC